jgi:transcriptional regulator with XRE-family HTH domain
MYVNGLTQKECAKKLGIDRSTLVRYLNNKITDERAIQTLRLSTSTYCALD